MRFFSNEAQDNVDDKNNRHDDPDATAPVPQQRPGSPWQHDTDPANTATSTSVVDDADRTVAFSDGVTRDRDDVEPAPKHSLPDDTAPKHKLPDDTVPAAENDKIKTDDGVRPDDTTVDSALDDRGTFDDPHVKDTDSTGPDVKKTDAETDPDFKKTDTETDPDVKDTGSGVTESEPDLKDTEPEAAKDEPAPVHETDPTPEPLVTPVAAPATATGPLPFFPAADTQPLRDRWRDVQLRFVDDPKGATADAAGLVDEAVDKLSTALRDHKGSFAKGTDDTEALRVELRSYRDILDRLLGL
ncbi:hypothetical protein Q0Z83_077670 [Actinoplanes sichuanensis]|uniref:Uncharacterized protein n=1 Tax=Actinoplanes sichuanensis TaxID=512349 RepID=A0ABW4AE36_9ACTN|nr:hypothetical protein [Actinoplanes sichuanensis]BEL09576.1 hypothetical protein Q0Z83_077670 [Actinoplanes sichuanensis]